MFSSIDVLQNLCLCDTKVHFTVIKKKEIRKSLNIIRQQKKKSKKFEHYKTTKAKEKEKKKKELTNGTLADGASRG